MIPDLDIYRSANLLVKRHGQDAPIEAAMRADAMLEAGDLAPIIHDGHRIWARRGVLAGLTAVFRDGFLERLEVDVRGSSGGTCRLV